MLWQLFECLDYNDWIVVLLNVLFFMVVQTLFFRFIASKQYENVLLDKLGLVSEFVSKQPQYKIALDKERKDYLEQNKRFIEAQRKTRYALNDQFEVDYCWKYIIFALVALLVIFAINPKDWTTFHTLGVIFILISYTTELLFFFGMVQQYEFVGDHTVINSLVKGVL